MSTFTVRLPDEVFSEVNVIAKKLHMSRSEYVRHSIEQMNKNIYDQQRKNKLIQASKRVREESMAVNSEFSQIEHDPKT